MMMMTMKIDGDDGDCDILMKAVVVVVVVNDVLTGEAEEEEVVGVGVVIEVVMDRKASFGLVVWALLVWVLVAWEPAVPSGILWAW